MALFGGDDSGGKGGFAALIAKRPMPGEAPADEETSPEAPVADDATIAAEDLVAAMRERNPDAVLVALRAIFEAFQAEGAGEAEME